MRKILSAILLLSVALGCLTACGGRVICGFGEADPNTTYEGVYITIDEVDNSDSHPVLCVSWHNESEATVTYGLGYRIERLDGDVWVDVQICDFAIPEIACMLDPGDSGTQRYRTQYFNLLLEGEYRIITEFYVPDENVGAQSTWAYFEVDYFY